MFRCARGGSSSTGLACNSDALTRQRAWRQGLTKRRVRPGGAVSVRGRVSVTALWSFNKREEQAAPGSLVVSKTTRPDGPDVPPPLRDGDVDDDAPVDFYQLLDCTPDASAEDIKAAYRRLMKLCHPDVLSDGEECSILLNEAYETLSNEMTRMAYDVALSAARLFSGLAPRPGMRPYTGESFSEWLGQDPLGGGWDQRSVFVDEVTCIGCRNCTHCAPKSFALEDEWGRARVFAQWADSEQDIQTAIDSCPVNCIHWTPKRSLPVLEFVMQVPKRVSVAAMATNSGVQSQSPFDLAETFTRRAREREARSAAGVSDAATKAGQLQLRMRDVWLRLDPRTRAQWRVAVSR